MSNPTATPEAVVEAYVATWKETDPRAAAPALRRPGLRRGSTAIR